MDDWFDLPQPKESTKQDDWFDVKSTPPPAKASSLETSAQDLADKIWSGDFKTRQGESMAPFGTPNERQVEAIARLHGKRVPVRAPDPNPIDIDRFINSHVAIGDIEKSVNASGQKYSDPDFRRLVRQRIELLAQQKANATQPDTATNVLNYVGDRFIPFAGHPDLQTTDQRAMQAAKAVAEGRATQQDFNVIAQAKERADQAKHEGVAEKIVDFASRAPGFIGENIASGGLAGQTVLGGISRYAGNVMSGAEPAEAGKVLGQEAITNAAFGLAGGLPGMNTSHSIVTSVPKLTVASNIGHEAGYSLGLTDQPSAITRAGRGEPGAVKELLAEVGGFGLVEGAPRAFKSIYGQRGPKPSREPVQEPPKVAEVPQQSVPTEMGQIPQALAELFGMAPKPEELSIPVEPVRPAVAQAAPPAAGIAEKAPGIGQPPDASNAKFGEAKFNEAFRESFPKVPGFTTEQELREPSLSPETPFQAIVADESAPIDLRKAARKVVRGEATPEESQQVLDWHQTVTRNTQLAGGAEFVPPLSRLDRMRAAQAGQTPLAKPSGDPTLRGADAAIPEKSPVTNANVTASSPVPLDINASKWDILDAAKGKLNDRQMEILNRRLEGEGLDDIAGGKVSRQAIKDAETRIQKKLGLPVSVNEWLMKNRPDELVRSVERGEVVRDELKGVPDEVIGRISKQDQAIDRTIKQLDALTEKFIKEKSRGKLTAEREAEIRDEFARLDESLKVQSRPKAEEPAQVPERSRPPAEPTAPSQPEAPVAQAKTLKPSGRNKAYEQEAVDLGYDLADYRGAVQMAKEMHAAEFGAHNEAVREIRDRLGSVAKVAHRAEDAGALESFKPKGGRQGQSIDEAGNDIVAGGRHVLDKNNPSESAFQKLQKGVVQDLTSKEVHDRAMAMLEDAKAFREANRGDAFEGGGPEFASSREGELPGDVPFKRMAKMIGRQLWEDDAGAWTVTAAVNKGAEHFSAIRDSTRRLAGQTFPTTTDIDRPSGEAMARKIAAKQWGRDAGPFFTDLVAKDATPQDRKFLGAVSTELHLRSTKAYFEKQRVQNATNLTSLVAQMRAATNPKDREALRLQAKETYKTMREYEAMRDDVTTVFGMPDSPINTEPEFQQALRDPKFLDFVKNYRQEVSPVLEDFYRRSLAIPQGQPIPITSQIPGFVMNLKNIDRPRPTVGNEGNLRNVRQKKLEFARTRSGASDAYDLDVGEIIANSFEKSADVAARADLDNALIKAGLAKLGFPGSVKDINGMPVKSIPFAKGERTLFVAEPVYNEYRDAINPDRSARLDYVTPAMNAVTKANLFLPAVEVGTHGSNLIGALFAPKAIQGTLKSVYDKITNNEVWRKQVLELSRINAQKSHGLETPAFKYDPAQVGGKALDWVNDIIRVGLNNAFDIIAKNNPSVPNTETNRRDFINQNVGQYNRLAQNKMIRWAREFGIGPFATAGSTMTMRAIRSLGGSPMIDAGGTATNLKLRAEVLAKRMAVIGIVGAANYAIWGNIMGDDKTPLGSLKVGEKPDGTTVFVDLPGATELRRGLRSTGLLSIIQGNRAGMSSGKIKDKAVEDIGHAVAHPILGPAATFAETAWTGENYFGRKIADKASDSESQKFNNFLAALKTANPFVSAVTGWDNPKEDAPWDERLAKLLGPLGPKYRKK